MPTIKAAARRRFRSGDSREPRMEYNDIHCDDGRHLKEKSKKEAAWPWPWPATSMFVSRGRARVGHSLPKCVFYRVTYALPAHLTAYSLSCPKMYNNKNSAISGDVVCRDRSLVRICKATRLMDRWTGEARWMDETDADSAAHMQNLFKAKRTEICPHTRAHCPRRKCHRRSLSSFVRPALFPTGWQEPGFWH